MTVIAALAGGVLGGGSVAVVQGSRSDPHVCVGHQMDPICDGPTWHWSQITAAPVAVGVIVGMVLLLVVAMVVHRRRRHQRHDM